MSSFMVIGMGRFGRAVATELFEIGHEVMVVDEVEDEVIKVADYVTHAIVGDAKDEAVLRSIGANNFDCVIVSITSDLSDSILTTLMLKEMKVKKIVCKARDERHAKALTLIGADIVIRPEYDMGKRVAHSLAQTNILDFIELSSDYSIVEIHTPKKWIGRSIVENDLRKRYGITVIAIRTVNSKEINISPDANYVLKENETLVIIGNMDSLDAIDEIH